VSAFSKNEMITRNVKRWYIGCPYEALLTAWSKINKHVFELRGDTDTMPMTSDIESVQNQKVEPRKFYATTVYAKLIHRNW